jgi:adenylate cyclase
MNSQTDFHPLQPQWPSYTKVVMVLDVVESVRLMEHDESGFIQRWQEFVRAARQGVLPRHGGTMHKSLGDGLMLEFADARGSVRAAFELIETCARINRDWPDAHPMHLRVGAHLARFVRDEFDIYGSDVNLAARICSMAGPGQTVVSASVRDDIVEYLDADLVDLGECYLKHVEHPLHLYEVRPVGAAPIAVPLPADPTDLRPTIAVIPFSARAVAQGEEVLGEVLAEEIIAGLSRTPEFNVISRLSTTALRGRDSQLSEIATHLNAGYVLSGAYRVTGTHVVLVAELADARSGRTIWADSLRSTVDEVLRGEDHITQETISRAGAAVANIEAQRASSKPLPNLHSSTLLIGAVSLMHRSTRSEFSRVREMLEFLIERHRRLPVPRAWLAKWHVLQVTRGLSQGGKAQANLALDQTQRALDSDPQCSLALTVEGFVHCQMLRDLDTAGDRYEQALAINPNESLAWLFLGVLHSFRGEGEAALAASERALSLSPIDPMLYFYQSLTASAALAAGHYDRVIQLAGASLKSNRSHTSTYRALAVAQAMSGDLENARRTVESLLKLEPGFTVAQFLNRSPSGNQPVGKRYAEALRLAGVPAG